MTGMNEVRGEASLGERRAGGVFVGRERELSELLVGVDDALEGRGRLFLVAGEPGIGKSRLTDELGRRQWSEAYACSTAGVGKRGAHPRIGHGCRRCARTSVSSPRRSCACSLVRVRPS